MGVYCKYEGKLYLVKSGTYREVGIHTYLTDEGWVDACVCPTCGAEYPPNLEGSHKCKNGKKEKETEV